MEIVELLWDPGVEGRCAHACYLCRRVGFIVVLCGFSGSGLGDLGRGIDSHCCDEAGSDQQFCFPLAKLLCSLFILILGMTSSKRSLVARWF